MEDLAGMTKGETSMETEVAQSDKGNSDLSFEQNHCCVTGWKQFSFRTKTCKAAECRVMVIVIISSSSPRISVSGDVHNSTSRFLDP